MSAPKKILVGVLAVVCTLLAGGPVAADGKNVLASGVRDGTYHDAYGPNLIRLMPAFRISNRSTKGSVENLELLANGRVDLGFAQADVFAEKLQGDRERFGGLTVVGRLTDECIFLARKLDGPIRDLSALMAPVDGRAPRVAVGPPTGGMAATWRMLSTYEPKLGAAEVSNTGGTLALNKLALGAFDAVGWVTDPRNLEHLLLRAVHANDELALMTVDLPDLDAKLDDGTPVYRVESVRVTSNERDPYHRTMCTSALLLARKGAPPRLVEAAAQAIALHRDELLKVDD